MNKGLVIKSTGSWYYVRGKDGNAIPCKIKGNFRIKGIRATNPIAVGDKVEFLLNEDGSGLIVQIEDRKNYIIRRSANLSREYQLIASNIDQAILMISLYQPKTQLGFIDRFLVSAEAFRIPVLLVINKVDLLEKSRKEELDNLINLYEKIGYVCLPVSIKRGDNLETLKDLLTGKITVINGNSGVGKSTFLNYLDPSLDLRTREISSYHKSGQHTTTNAEMFFFPSETMIIDTPGIKGFGMVDIEKEELFHFFPEIFLHSKDCKFHNCIHFNEPDCAVIEAVNLKLISESRYFNYLALLEDMGDKYRK